MSNQIGKKTSKTRPSGAYIIFIISLSLCLLGLTGSFIIHSKSIADNIKEKMEITAVLNDSLQPAAILQLQQLIKEKKYVKSIQFVSKEAAANSLKQDFEEDFLKVLDYNPLYNSFAIFLNAENTQNAELNTIEKELASIEGVKEIFFQKSIIELLNKNIKKAILITAILSVLFIIITLAIIDSNIKLTMFADRFLIKNMQLVGATKSFIRAPYLKKGMIYGIISALMAILLIAIFNYFIYLQIPDLIHLNNTYLFALLAIFILIFGLIISLLSTFMAVSKYLNSKLEDLY